MSSRTVEQIAAQVDASDTTAKNWIRAWKSRTRAQKSVSRDDVVAYLYQVARECGDDGAMTQIHRVVDLLMSFNMKSKTKNREPEPENRDQPTTLAEVLREELERNPVIKRWQETLARLMIERGLIPTNKSGRPM